MNFVHLMHQGCAPGHSMCNSGGGDGGDDGGAAAREAERQARIAAGTAKVNELFGVGPASTFVPTGQKTINGYRNLADQSVISQADYDQIAKAGQVYNTGRYVAPGAESGAESWEQTVLSPSSFAPVYQDIMKEVESPASIAARQRQALYDTTRDDTRKFFSSQLEEDSAKAARDMKFQQARSGLFGSSQANDMDTEYQRRMDRGLLDVANRADSTATQFKTNDEQTRLNLISKIVAGLDQGSAVSNAAASLQTNAAAAKEAFQSQRMGNVFQDMLGAYNAGQYNNGMQAAQQQQGNALGNFYNTGNKSADGTVTKGF